MISQTPALAAPIDITTGHGSWPPVGYLPPPNGMSANVVINGRFVHKVGDTTFPHFARIPLPPPVGDLHPDTILTGSPSVMVNGTPMAVVGSELVCVFGPAGKVTGLGAFTVIVDSQGAADSADSSVDDITAPETAPDDELPPDDGGSFELF